MDESNLAVPQSALDELGHTARGLRLISSWSFAVWMGREIVVHVATSETSPRLARTAHLLAELPAESGRPELLALGHGWMATRRFTGRPLMKRGHHFPSGLDGARPHS